MSEAQIYDLECILSALIAGALVLTLLVPRLRRGRPRFRIGHAIAVAFGLRVLGALVVTASPGAEQLRGGDEITFKANAAGLTGWDFFSTGTFKALTHQFHVFFFSLNDRVFSDVPDMMLRIEVITLAVAGLALIAAAVYELAGARAATITGWILALEPSNIFFSGILHKEPFMMLAEGLVAYGGAVLWKRGRLTALVPMVAGCLLATATRPYVGWFLAAGAAAVALHSALRRRKSITSVALAIAIVGLGIVFFPAVWNASSSKNLQKLQTSQDANAADKSANLSLERVDYSSRGKIIVNLPQRMIDIATRPYPWQVGNASQQLGVLGTMFLVGALVLLISALMNNGRAIMQRAGPLIYPLLFLLVAYSLSAGNAGTAYRYRTHLVALLVGVICVLRASRSPQPTGVAAHRGRLQQMVPHAQRI